MSDNELRDRIERVIAAELDRVDVFTVADIAQAVIDDLGLDVETQSLRWLDPNGPFPQSRVVGKWEKA